MAVTAVFLALGGALFVAIGFVVQQHAAAEEPPSERLSFSLLIHLVRRPLWLAGIGAMIVGQLLGAAALSKGTLALVTPLNATNLLFALPLSAVWHRCRLGRREWGGAFALIAGLAAFILAGNPHGGSSTKLPWPNWVIAGGTIVLLAAAVVALSRRRNAVRQATMLAASAGLLYGLQDALTQRTIAQIGHGAVSLFTSWPAFALVAVAVFALLLGQSAFEAAPLPASMPAITMAEPITGIAFGAGVYGEHLSLGGALLAVELLGVASMVAGVYLVATSPVVTNQVKSDHSRAEGFERVA